MTDRSRVVVPDIEGLQNQNRYHMKANAILNDNCVNSFKSMLVRFLRNPKFPNLQHSVGSLHRIPSY